MEIPQIIKKGSNKFKLVKEYKRYCLYQNTKAKYYECFSMYDIYLIKNNLEDKRKNKGD